MMKKRFYNISLLIALIILMISCANKKTEKQAIERDYKAILTENEFQLDSLDKDRMIVDLILEAKKHEDRRDYTKALIVYKNALELDTTASLLYMEGNSYYNLNIFHKAKRSLKKSLLFEPDFEDALRKLIKIYLIESDIQRANILIAELEKISSSKKSMEIVAEFYSNVNPEKAIDIYEQLYKKYQDQGYENELLRLYSTLKDQHKYYEYLKKNIFNSPSYNISMARSLTLHYIKENQYKGFSELIEYININFTQEDVNSYYNSLANYIYSNFFDIPDNIRDIYINNIDNRFIFEPNIAFRSGVVAYEMNLNDKSEKYFNWALKSTEEGDENIPFSIGYFYFEKKLHDKAINIFESYRSDSSRFWETDYYLAHSYLANDDRKNASKYLKNAIEIDSTQYFIYTDLGLIYDMEEKPDSAIYYYEKALKLEPNNITTMNNMAYTMAVQEIRLNEAEEMIQKVIDVDPDNPTFLDTYAWVKFKLGKTETAKEFLLKALEKTQENAEIHLHLAEVYKKLGILEKAKESVNKAFEIAPDNKDVEKLIRELKMK